MFRLYLTRLLTTPFVMVFELLTIWMLIFRPLILIFNLLWIVFAIPMSIVGLYLIHNPVTRKFNIINLKELKNIVDFGGRQY